MIGTVPGNPLCSNRMDMDPAPSTVARMLDLQIEADHLWSDGELADVWAHQLAAPLVSDLAAQRATDAAALDALQSPAGEGGGPIGTFGELLGDAGPPIELLILSKEFGKRAKTVDPEGPLPPEVGTMLYFASIAAALVRYGRRISSLSDAELRDGFAWGSACPWVDRGVRRLLEQGLSSLARGA